MKTEKGKEFTTGFFTYATIGFHATSESASVDIEKNGFSPNKIFRSNEHDEVMRIANELKINAYMYSQWLEMRSVTFAREFNSTVEHILKGSASGGQGLENMIEVLIEIKEKGNETQKATAEKYLEKIDEIKISAPVIYAVDLSHLGKRLVSDKKQPLYHIYWQPSCELPPSEQLVTNVHLIAKLEFDKNA